MQDYNSATFDTLNFGNELAGDGSVNNGVGTVPTSKAAWGLHNCGSR